MQTMTAMNAPEMAPATAGQVTAEAQHPRPAPDRPGVATRIARGMAFDKNFFVESNDYRVHQVRLEGGDSSSDSYCFP